MSQEEDRKIVKFNVGGTRYEVARSLIGMHPDTMLARIVSSEWQVDPSKEVFVERNGSRFKYVLDYLRDGKVYLSIDLFKEAILDEMDYFGITYDGGDVQYVQLGSIHSSEAILASSTSKLFRFVHICLLHLPRPFFKKRLEFSVYKNDESEFHGICITMAEIMFSSNDIRKPKLLELCKCYGFSPQEIEVHRARPMRSGLPRDFDRCIVTLQIL